MSDVKLYACCEHCATPGDWGHLVGKDRHMVACGHGCNK